MEYMRKIRTGVLIVTLLVMILTAVPAVLASGGDMTGAAGDKTTADEIAAPFDGYLVKLDGDAARLFSADEDENLTAIAPDVYLAEDLEAAERLESLGVVSYMEPNYIILLEDPEENPGENPEENPGENPEEDPEENPGEDENENLEDEDWEETPWYFDMLNMDYAEKYKITGKGVRIGVIDSGINFDHEEFTGAKILEGKNYINEDEPPTDTVGHGTFIGGLIAAQAGNRVGMKGLAPDAEIVPLKCFDAKKGAVAGIVKGVYDSVDVWNCQVLNLSFSIDYDSKILREAIEHALESGVIVIAAAGNLSAGTAHKDGGDPLTYPAAWPGVIGVGAVTKDWVAASYSYRNTSVYISAPGSGLSAPACYSPISYITGSGTSYAAPMVTAAAALALSIKPDLTPDGFAALLSDTATDCGDPGYDIIYGDGILNIGWLLAAARGDVTGQASAMLRAMEAREIYPSALLLCAYDEQGAFLSMKSFAISPDSLSKFNFNFSFYLKTSEYRGVNPAAWKLFALDIENYQPLWKSYQIRK